MTRPTDGHDRTTSARIVLVRHGQTPWSRTGRHTGVTDLPLTDVGKEQALAVAPILSRWQFGLVLSSPRQRALETARLTGFGDRVQVEPSLAEWDYGAYEGLTTQQIVEQRGGPWDLWSDGVPPGETPGESAAEVRQRANAVLGRAVETLDQNQNVLLFGHGHILRALAVAWVDLPPTAGYMFTLSTSTISELGYEHGRDVLSRWNAPADWSAPNAPDGQGASSNL